MLFDKFESRIVIKGEIEVVKPLHIGAVADSLDPVQVDSAVIKDSRNRPLIPGSSMKGVLRSMLEVLFANPHFKNKYRSCNILEEKKKCLGKKTIDKLQKECTNPRELAEKIYEKSCDVCRMFGNGQIASRIQIKDMFCIADKAMFERRDGVGIDRDSGTAYPGAKYGYEVVPAGTRFDFYLTAENLEDKYRKVLDYIIELLEKGEISIGGKTSRGLGQIKLNNKKVETLTPEMIAKKLDFSSGGENDV